MKKLLIASILATTISFANAQGRSVEIAPIIEVFEEQLSNVRSTIRKLEAGAFHHGSKSLSAASSTISTRPCFRSSSGIPPMLGFGLMSHRQALTGYSTIFRTSEIPRITLPSRNWKHDAILGGQSNDLAAFQQLLQDCLADTQLPLDPGCIGKRSSLARNGDSSSRSVQPSFAFLWTD